MSERKPKMNEKRKRLEERTTTDEFERKEKHFHRPQQRIIEEM